MNRLQKVVLSLLLFRWESGFAATVGGAAGLGASLTGHDPWTWVIGGFGAAIVYAKNPAKSKVDAVANAVISVMLAGVVSHPVAAYLGVKFDPNLNHPHVVAFLLSAAWPWVIPALKSRWDATVSKASAPKEKS